MLRVNYVLGLHELLDFWVNTSLLDLRDLDKYGLGKRRPVQDYWQFASVSPHRFGPEWSINRCDVFQTTGLEPYLVEEHGDYNDYSRYADSFQYGEAPPPPPPSENKKNDANEQRKRRQHR